MDIPPPSTASPRSSLARSTLIKLGVGTAVVIALATLASYLHLFQALRAEALLRLERNVSERSLREQVIFVLAEDNHVILKAALEERLEALRQEDPGPRFDSLFVHLPDGTVRNRPERFDGKRMPGVFIPKGVVVDSDLRRKLLAAYDVLVQYGPAFHVRFTNTYITLPGGAIALYWPERPTWCQEAAPDMVSSDFEFFTISRPEQNPRRKTAWTGIFLDPVAQAWLVSVSTPVDESGQHALTISHDILIQELMARTVNDRLPGTYNILLREDGQLIAHPQLKMEGATEAYNILSATAQPGATAPQLAAEPRAHLRQLFQQVKQRGPGQQVQTIEDGQEYAAIAEVKGPGWLLATMLPKHVVSAAAFRSARYVLLFGVLSLLLELAIMYWVLKRQITQPLLTFNQATAKLAAGDFKVSLSTSRNDELGQLANAFLRMTEELQRREEALRQANEGLEQRVEQRTQELKEVHRQLVETARLVGRAEIATNVLHNVGNVLNSVNTAALLAKERLDKLKLDSMERVVGLFEQNRSNLPHFLTHDDQGKTALEFLGRLGKHLQGERQQIRTLLGDVHRHTVHIGAIVKLQQRYARTASELFESVQLEELVEDALRINQAALGRHSVKVELALERLPPVMTEKHKVLMILVNLISNAKYAMDEKPEDERRMTVSLKQADANRVHLEVRDNGVGIAPEMIKRIFQYGFTTRQEGHGFGLHSSALAAQELGGALLVHSDGPGKGATFTLELPTNGEKQREQAHA